MRYVTLLLILWFSSPTFAGAGSSEADPEFGELSGMKLIEALKFLDQNHDIRFSYNPDDLAQLVVPEFDIPVNDVTQFLRLTLVDTSYDFEKISGTYVIFPKEGKNATNASEQNFSLTGLIRDKSTRETLPYATISLQGTSISTISNSEGMFTLLNVPIDTLQLEVSYLGYMPFRKSLREIDEEGLLICELVRTQRNLPSIEIQAQTEKLITIDRKPSQLTFNPAQISKLPSLGENDLFSALRRFPGISGAQDATSGLKIRGGNSDQNLVLFDGITIYHVDHFFGFLSAFNSNMVKNVQVMKGGFEAKYGGRASGVVNITGIDGNKLKPSVSLEANLLSVNGLLELPIVQDKASLTIGYRHAYTAIIQTPAYKKMFNNSFNSSLPNGDGNTDAFDGHSDPDYSYHDFNAKFNFKPTKKDAISFSFYEGKDDVKIKFDGTFENLERVAEDDTKWGNQGGSIKWSRKWNKSLFSYLNHSLSNYKSDLTAVESFYFANNDTLLSQLFFDQRVSVRDHTFRLDNTWELNSKSKLDFGYWYTQNEITLQAQNQTTILQDSLQKGESHAGYFDFSQTIKNWTFNFGLRGTHYDLMSEFYVDPRLSFTYQINKAISLKGAFGIYRQMIRRLNERSLYLSVPETWALASPTTVPLLKSKHYILGFSVQKTGWTFNLEGYHKYENGSVEFLHPEFGNPTGNLDQFAIGGRKRIFGLDVLLKKSFRKGDLLFGYTFLQSDSKYDEIDDGAYFKSAGVSDHEFNLVYHYEIKRWDFSAGFVFATGTPYTPVLGTYTVTLPSGEQQQVISIGETNSATLDPYHRLDIEASYTLPIKKGIFQVGISIYNVYNNLGVKFIDYYEIPIANSEFYSLGKNEIYTLGTTPSVFLKIRL